MTKPRSKVTLDNYEIATQTELQSTVANVAKLMLRERDLKNMMDGELQEVRARYEADLARAAAEVDGYTELCAEYCTSHPDLFPRDRKSLDLVHAIIGFRTGTPKVKVLKRWTVKAVLDAIKFRKWFHLIRTTEELDREAVLANREKLSDVLVTVGLEIAQEETFFIEPKLETQPAGVKVEAA